MPTGLRRLQGGGQPHFITFSCFHRQPYLKDPAARDIFEQKFEAVRDKYGFFISAYVVMPNHVHLLISECPAALPGTCMQSLKIRVSGWESQSVPSATSSRPTYARTERVHIWGTERSLRPRGLLMPVC